MIFHDNFLKCKNLLSSTPVHALKTEWQINSKTSLLLEHNLPYTRHVKFEKLQYLIRRQLRFILHLQDMNNMACPAA